MITEDNYDGIICKVCNKEIVNDFICIQHCQKLKQTKEIEMNIEYCCQDCWNKKIKHKK